MASYTPYALSMQQNVNELPAWAQAQKSPEEINDFLMQEWSEKYNALEGPLKSRQHRFFEYMRTMSAKTLATKAERAVKRQDATEEDYLFFFYALNNLSDWDRHDTQLSSFKGLNTVPVYAFIQMSSFSEAFKREWTSRFEIQSEL